MLHRLFPTFLLLGAAILAGTGCTKSEPEHGVGPQPGAEPERHAGPVSGVDYHSFANTGDYRVRHLDLDLTVDFSRKVLEGEAILQIERLNEENNPLVLDTRGLSIESVRAGDGEHFEETAFSLTDSDDILGQALSIELPGDATTVAIRYRTDPEASGLQWLEPRQTAGKRHPFLFTQAQAIHARSFVPLQDTPGVRITYNATIRTPRELRAVMSANNDPDAGHDGVYRFSMPQPIPSYLIALAVGDLEFKAMGKRTGVYAERELLDAAAAEFADTEAMLEMAIVENIQREDLNPIEIALGYQRLIDEVGLKQENLAQKVGKSRSAGTNLLRLLKLPPAVQASLRDGSISAGHARALLAIGDETTRLELHQAIVSQGLSVREVERLVRSQRAVSPKKKTSAEPKTPGQVVLTPRDRLEIEGLEARLREHLGTKIKIQHKPTDHSGTIQITYFSLEDLERLISQIAH